MASLRGKDRFSDPDIGSVPSYVQISVLAVGSGPILVSLVASLFESGLSRFHILITDSVPTDRQRLAKLAENARRANPEAALEEITLHSEAGDCWQKAVRPFHAILYVSQAGDIEELRTVHTACREEGKMLLPAICIRQTGVAGPLVHPDTEGCWESAWRRIHRTLLYNNTQHHSYSASAGALLANVIVYELLHAVTGLADAQLTNRLFVIDLETLEGDRHPFLPHPLVTGRAAAKWVHEVGLRLERGSRSSGPDLLLPCFDRLTSVQVGIFHTWEEGDLQQLPLAQCRVQVADPLSEGPAELLPDIVCSDFTHLEARREAGLAGIEAYVSRLAGQLVMLLPALPGMVDGNANQHEFMGIGAGETFAEGVCRGLHQCLTEQLNKREAERNPAVKAVQFHAIEDKRCRYYLQALTAIQGTPTIGLGEEVCGLPVVWIGTSGRLYRCVGLNVTMAFRRALQHALQQAQNQETKPTADGCSIRPIFLEQPEPLRLSIPSIEETTQTKMLQSAIPILEQSGKRLIVYELTGSLFTQGEPVMVFGTMLREAVSR